jgi:hypothetical protein
MTNGLGAATLHVLPEMPDRDEKVQLTFRLSAGAVRRLNALADSQELERAAVVDMALKHLEGTIARGLGIYAGAPRPGEPDDTPKGPRGDAA